MKNSLLMLDLVRAFYWFDEQLRSRLAEQGFTAVTRSQSLVLANVANGETRASRIAANLGVSRQAMSQLLAEMVNNGLVDTAPDPADRRAQVVFFGPAGEEIRIAAQKILRDLEGEMERALGKTQMLALRTALRHWPPQD
ncbi:MarR family winged helix-turn-helix transcriptional regulator [Parapedomonas caeni]